MAIRAADECLDLLERLRAKTPEGTTVSIGAAQWQPTGSATGSACRAGLTMYAAKRAGCDCVVIDHAHAD